MVKKPRQVKKELDKLDTRDFDRISEEVNKIVNPEIPKRISNALSRLVRGRSAKHIPDGYVDYILCKMFHCLPSQLEKEDNKKLELFLYINALEQK